MLCYCSLVTRKNGVYGVRFDLFEGLMRLDIGNKVDEILSAVYMKYAKNCIVSFI